jgi:hypothetical protein
LDVPFKVRPAVVELYVALPVNDLALVVLSTHVVTIVPFDGAVPVFKGSFPSSHNCIPFIEAGVNGVNLVTGGIV